MEYIYRPIPLPEQLRTTFSMNEYRDAFVPGAPPKPKIEGLSRKELLFEADRHLAYLFEHGYARTEEVVEVKIIKDVRGQVWYGLLFARPRKPRRAAPWFFGTVIRFRMRASGSSATSVSAQVRHDYLALAKRVAGLNAQKMRSLKTFQHYAGSHVELPEHASVDLVETTDRLIVALLDKPPENRRGIPL